MKGRSTVEKESEQSESRPCLDTPKNQKLYKIPHHIESYGTCMKH